ncbi:DUF1365 domain-containing protein [Nocardia callitridis]|uniref:DUF1365 domain-containing protein n=1 Tax=Nocardia callitridis TaxID=648753 RepID=A0ABP9L5R1_9NOCA
MTTPRTHTTTARIVRTRIHHTRLDPTRYAFQTRSYSWLVDLDELPSLPRVLRPFAGFRSRDHQGDPQRTLRANIDTYLHENGIDLGGGRVRMLANASVLGYVFNPLTLYWCRDHDDQPICVVAEVHNTYGQRHRYLLRTDERGHARTPKEFYVSPFNEVRGEYRMRLPEPDERLHASIVLADPEPVFVAAMTGRCLTATTGTVLRAIIEVPLAPLLVAVLIRWHGVRLWARGLHIIPRPAYLEEASR